MAGSITRRDLQDGLKSGSIVLVNVLPPKYFERAHIPGGVNHCVYQVDFVDSMRKAIPANADIVLYANGVSNRAMADAAAKLAAAGYTLVRVYEGGLDDWRAAGLAVEGTGEGLPEEETLQRLQGAGDVRLELDKEESRVTWFGRSLTTTHRGTSGLKSGHMDFNDGRLAGGEVVLDMNDLANENLDDVSLRSVLIAHLMSEDFFEARTYPEAKFEIDRVEPLVQAGEPSSSNVRLYGRMTIKGVAREMSVDAVVAPREDGRMALVAELSLDRTDFGVLYGSGKFYQHLGMHLVHDRIDLEVRLVVVG